MCSLRGTNSKVRCRPGASMPLLLQFVECEVEFQDVDSRFAENTKRSSIGVLVN